jgi:hypothetical protein
LASANHTFEKLRQIPNIEHINELPFFGQHSAVLQAQRPLPQGKACGTNGLVA